MDAEFQSKESQTPGLTPVQGRIGVVTVTYNSARVIDDFLRSLSLQTYRNFMLIAVDNASSDSTLAVLRGFVSAQDLIFANDENLGIAAGNNQGVLAALDAGCEYVLLINNDVIFGPELFSKLVGGLIEQNADMSTPLMFYHDRPDVFWAAGGYFQPWLGYRCLHYGIDNKDTGQFNTPRRVQHTPHCCILIHRSVFEIAGFIDERYFVYNEDTDFSLRAWKLGMSLVCLPNAKLWHKVSSLTTKGSRFFIRYGTRNRAFYMGKYLGRIALGFIGVFYNAYYLWRWLRRKDDSQTLRLKMSSWREGASISKNWLPQSPAKAI